MGGEKCERSLESTLAGVGVEVELVFMRHGRASSAGKTSRSISTPSALRAFAGACDCGKNAI
jgi:hypothetical protein